jgi:predicted nucleic acid-binding protein
VALQLDNKMTGKKLYIDTNVIIDAIEGRKNKFGRSMGNPAANLFFESISCKYYIVISTWTLEELSGLRLIEKTKMFFELAKKKIITVDYTKSEKVEAKNRSKEHFDDALHIILAEKESADYIITRNVDHFEMIGTKIPIRKPEKLI